MMDKFSVKSLEVTEIHLHIFLVIFKLESIQINIENSNLYQ